MVHSYIWCHVNCCHYLLLQKEMLFLLSYFSWIYGLILQYAWSMICNYFYASNGTSTMKWPLCCLAQKVTRSKETADSIMSNGCHSLRLSKHFITFAPQTNFFSFMVQLLGSFSSPLQYSSLFVDCMVSEIILPAKRVTLRGCKPRGFI